jgi:exodeoxyribonuclease VII small subunit
MALGFEKATLAAAARDRLRTPSCRAGRRRIDCADKDTPGMASETEGGAAEAEEGFEDIARMSFEQALEELEEIVRRLESGEIDLERAIEAYARGAALKRHCDRKLRQAEQRVSRITVSEDGSLSAEPLDLGGGTGG